MKTIISYLCLTTSLFSAISSSLPIPERHYVLSTMQELVPVLTGAGAGLGAAAGVPLGRGGVASGYALGGAAGMAGGVVGGAAMGAFRKATNAPCLEGEGSRWSSAVKAIFGGVLAGAGSGSLVSIPVAAGTSAMVDGAIRNLDRHAGECERPY